MKKENEIDQLFKKGLEDPEIPFNELDWTKMADKLDAGKSRKDRSLWYVLSGIAAFLLLGLFLFLFENNSNTGDKKKPQFNVKAKPLTNDNKPSRGIVTPPQKHTDTRSDLEDFASGEDITPPNAMATVARNGEVLIAGKAPMLQELTTFRWPVPGIVGLEQQHAVALSIPKHNDQMQKIPENVNDRKPPAPEKVNAAPGKLTLSILAAPDVTNTRSSIGTKISSNFGLMLTYPISKKLSISSGAIYARKLYDYGGIAASAYGIKNAAWEVNADCYVIDVPLNVNYQVLQKKKFSISLNSGLSSYFMLKEKYQYINVNAAGTQEVTNLQINNENKHFFGVANFSVKFDHKVNERVSIGVQPFLKVPLTGIGYYDTNLKSKGVAVSISLRPFNSKR